MISELVVDASVAIKLFVDEELAEAAEQLFRWLDHTPPARFFVPDLFFIECANILWKYIRRFGYSPQEARENLSRLLLLPLQTVAASDLLVASLDLAVKVDITAYDASYTALAASLQVPLVTADRTLARKLDSSGLEVHWLGDLPTN